MLKIWYTRRMIILGIDPGIERVGFAILESDARNFRLHEAGRITTPKTDPTAERLLAIRKNLNELILRHAPAVIAIEKIFFFRNKKTALKVAEARGVMVTMAAEFNLRLVELTPMEIKKYVSGDGHADKKQIQKMVGLILKLKEIPESDDTCDAIALAIAAGLQ